MDNKVSSTLEKALQDKSKGNFQKALKRLNDAVGKHPDEIELYLEAADVCLEGGESLQSTQYLKKALTRFRSEQSRIELFAREKLKAMNDPVLGKFLLEGSIKRRTLEEALELLEDLQDRTIRELLQRTRTKKQSLASATHGGYALKTESLINAMSEALLCLRLGRMKESVRSFLQVLDEKPVENEILEPFFAVIEKKFPKAGRIRYAYACSLLASQQYDKAISKLVNAVQMEPKIGDDCLDRLREMSDKFETPPESIRQALIEILMVTGDVPRAAELLEETLSEHPERAKGVLALVRPHLEDTENGLVLHYLYMEAALLADQTVRVLETLKALHKDESKRPDVFEWLENKSKEQFLPAEVLLFLGQMAVDAENFDSAMEIFTAVANNSHADIPTIVTLLEKHKDRDPRVTEFIQEHKQEQNTAAGYDDGGFEFEHFENNEFKFSGKPATDADGEQTAEPVQNDDNGRDEAGPEQENTLKEPEPEKVIDDEQPVAAADDSTNPGAEEIVWDEEDDSDTGVAENDDGDNSWLDTANDSIISDGGDESRPRLSPFKIASENQAETGATEDDTPAAAGPEYQIDEEHVRNLSEALRDAGAALFFHVEESSTDDYGEDFYGENEADTEATAEVEPEATVDEEPEATVEMEPNTTAEEEPEATVEEESEIVLEAEATVAVEAETDLDAEPAGESEEVEDEVFDGDEFELRFSHFLAGKLDNRETISLIQEALDAGKTDEVRELLYFDAADESEQQLRKRYQVEYYACRDLPARALEVLNGIDLSALSPENRREALIRKAGCEENINDFESANETYVILLDEFSSPEIKQKAKQNYEKYLKDQCDRKPVLEKVTSLNGD